MEADQERIESAGHANERFLGHKFLENVTYNGEPVAPLILSEGNDTEHGPHFKVERIGGVRMDFYMTNSDLPPVQRLKTLSFVLGQLQAIDDAGYVIFDRATRNIIILDSGTRLSVRQVDLEDIYDKKTDAVYSNQRRELYEGYIDREVKEGQSLWANEVGFLAYTLTNAMNQQTLKGVDMAKYAELLDHYRGEKNPAAVNALDNFKTDVDEIIKRYEVNPT